MKQQILIKVNSNDTSSAIKEFVSRFDDATIEEQTEDDNEHYLNVYGMAKSEFENQLNIGIAQGIVDIIKPWNDVKQQLFSKTDKRENHRTF